MQNGEWRRSNAKGRVFPSIFCIRHSAFADEGENRHDHHHQVLHAVKLSSQGRRSGGCDQEGVRRRFEAD
jgi:hypothetical protein